MLCSISTDLLQYAIFYSELKVPVPNQFIVWDTVPLPAYAKSKLVKLHSVYLSKNRTEQDGHPCMKQQYYEKACMSYGTLMEVTVCSILTNNNMPPLKLRVFIFFKACVCFLKHFLSLNKSKKYSFILILFSKIIVSSNVVHEWTAPEGHNWEWRSCRLI